MTHTKAIYAFFFFLFIVTLTAEKTQSQPSVIDIIPGDPTPKSTITFIASHFVNESVENVTLVVQECTNESCYNESIIKPMIKNDANNYEAMVTLLHDDTTYIQYYVECTSGGVVKQSPVLELEVKAQNSQNKTPAFEFLFIIVGIIIAFSLFAKRKPCVLSRNYFLLEKNNDDSASMRKLNQQKIRWIIKQIDKGEQSTYRIAKTQDITPRWARKLHHHFHTLYQYPYPKKAGRKPKPVTDTEKQIILDIRKQHPLAAVTLEKILSEQNIHIGHNRIHRILKEEGLVKDEPHKQRRRTWVRYERRYSNSLWHADWFEQTHEQIILFEDDASRFITGFGVFSNANTENSNQVLQQAITSYGRPKQMMTDHGTQFTSLPKVTCPDPRQNMFQQLLKQQGILHIKARVKHPQSNGKVERAGQTIEQLRKHFPNWEDTVYYYNFRRPHSSLENGHLRTPYKAFQDKMREKKKSGC